MGTRPMERLRRTTEVSVRLSRDSYVYGEHGIRRTPADPPPAVVPRYTVIVSPVQSGSCPASLRKCRRVSSQSFSTGKDRLRDSARPVHPRLARKYLRHTVGDSVPADFDCARLAGSLGSLNSDRRNLVR